MFNRPTYVVVVLVLCYNRRNGRRLCEVVRVTHDDGVELTFDNIVNDSSLYGSDVLNRIE